MLVRQGEPMIALIVALTILSGDPCPTLQASYNFPVTNPTELIEGNLLRNSPDEFRKLLRVPQPEFSSPEPAFQWITSFFNWFTELRLRLQSIPNRGIANTLVAKLNE